jgi:hypothetical protein
MQGILMSVMRRTWIITAIVAAIFLVYVSIGFFPNKKLASLDVFFPRGSEVERLLEFLSENNFEVSTLANGVWTAGDHFTMPPTYYGVWERDLEELCNANLCEFHYAIKVDYPDFGSQKFRIIYSYFWISDGVTVMNVLNVSPLLSTSFL